jgi:hypothetical protein
MSAVYELALVIAEVIYAHCPGTSARERFLHACISADWDEVTSEGLTDDAEVERR